MQFDVGDRVVYPTQGAGVVQEIASRDVLGERHEYLKIVFARGDMEILVPLTKGREVGLRPAVGKDELEQLEATVVQGDLSLPQQWPPRYRAEQEILAAGDAYQLARLIGVLARRDLEKGLAATEREVMESAKSLLASEIAVVSDSDLASAEARLASLLRERIG